MAEEKSIFSKLKPVNLNQDSSPLVDNTALNSEISYLKNGLSKIEKTLDEISQKVSLIKGGDLTDIKKEILNEIKNVSIKEFENSFKSLFDRVEELKKSIVNNLKNDILNEIKKEVSLRIEKNVEAINAIKNITSNDLNKLEELSVKLDLVLKLGENIKKISELDSDIKKSIAQSMNDISINLDLKYNTLSKLLSDEVSELAKKCIEENLVKVREDLIKEFSIVENSMSDEMRKSISNLSTDIISLSQRIENSIKFVSDNLKKEQKIPVDSISEIISDINKVSVVAKKIREEFDSIKADENISPIIFKKHYNNILMIENSISKIEEVMKIFISIIK